MKYIVKDDITIKINNKKVLLEKGDIIVSYDHLFESNSIKEMTFTVEKIGRKWIKAKSKFKDYNLAWDVEINDLTRDWEIGGTYTVTAKTDVQRSNYGTKRYAFPVSKENIETEKENEKLNYARKELERWLGYIEDNLKRYWYKKGEEKVLYFVKELPKEERQTYLDRLNKLKKQQIPYEIEKWLGYIKDNLKRYWYKKGEKKVLELARSIDKENKYKDILIELKDRFEAMNSKEDKKDNVITGMYPFADFLPLSGIMYNDDLNKYIKIVKTWSTYIGGDAMSFGGDADGYIHYARYEEPSKKELEDHKYMMAKKRDFIEKKKEIKNYFLRQAKPVSIPNRVRKRDIEKIYHFPNEGFNIYGGGEAYGIGRNSLWYIENNGADGDDWTRNNFETGGAGAVAKEFKYDERIADIIRELGIEGLINY